MKRPVKIIVVGGNAAGPAAAAKAKRFNPNADVILFEASEFISSGTCEMPYVLSNQIEDYRKLLFFSPASFENENEFVRSSIYCLNEIMPWVCFINVVFDRQCIGLGTR